MKRIKSRFRQENIADIQIEADIIEEVARIYGYNRLPSTLPSGETVAGELTKGQKTVRKVRHLLEGNGLSEAISYALTTKEKAAQFMLTPSLPKPLRLANDRRTCRFKNELSEWPFRRCSL